MTGVPAVTDVVSSFIPEAYLSSPAQPRRFGT